MENRVKSPVHHYTFSKTTQAPTRNSILQNISNMSSTFQRSTISTSKTKNQSRLGSAEKCKIKALPNYQKYSMGNNLPFVTVFQTIEIERLSDQIQTQRVKIKEYERQIFNASSFEIQIKQLTQRCTAYEQQISEYREQLDKMNKICQTIFHQHENLKEKLKNSDSFFKIKLDQEAKRNKQLDEQVQRWCQKYQISEQIKQKQIQEIKSMMEQQRKSMLDREIKDIQVRHQSQIARLSVQIRRLSQLLDIKQKDLEDLKLKHQNSQDYIKQLKDYGSKLSQYQQKICLLSQQHLRLSRIIDLNVSQLDNARKKQFKLNQQLKSDKQLIFDNEHLKQIVQLKQKQLQTWKFKIVELQGQVLKSRQLIHLNEQLSSKVQCLSQQNEKLSKLLKQRSAEIEKWKKTVLQLQDNNKRSRQIQDLLIQQQSKNKVLQAQNQRLDGVYKLRYRQLQQLKNKYVLAQNDLSHLSHFQKEKKNLEDKYKTQVERIMQLQLYIQKLQQQGKITKQTDNKLKSTQLMLQSLKRDNERLQQKSSQYQRQLTTLKNYQDQLAKQYVKIKQNDKLISEHQSKQLIMSQQMFRLSQMLKIKNDEIVKLQDQKISNFTALTQSKALQQQIQQKDRVINKLKTQIQTCQTKIVQNERTMEQIDTKNKQLFGNLNTQLMKLQSQVKQKSKQNDELKTRQAKMQNELGQIGHLQNLCQKQQNRITTYLKDLEDLRIQNRQYENLLNQERKKNQSAHRESQRIKISAEETLVKMLDSNKQGQSNKSIIQSNNLNNFDSQMLLNKVNSLQGILNDLKIKYSQLLKAVNGSQGTIQTGSHRTSITSVR